MAGRAGRRPGEAGQLDQVGDPGLLHHAGAMNLDGAMADAQAARDLLVGVAVGDSLMISRSRRVRLIARRTGAVPSKAARSGDEAVVASELSDASGLACNRSASA